MRLYYFSGSALPSPYANAVHVMKMCAALARAGHDVTLFGKGGGAPDDALYKAYDVARVFAIIRAPSLRLPGLSGLVRSLVTLWQARRLGRADIIYGRDLWTMAAMARRGTPLLLELHEIPASVWQRILLHRILSSLCLKGVVVISAALKEDLLRFYPYAAHKILIAPDGADAPGQPVPPASLQDIPGTDFQVGYGGSLYKGKGIELMAAIAALSPRTGFHVFGGPEVALRKWQALGLSSRIRFYGHIPHADLKYHLAACDALIAPYMKQVHIDTGADIARWISPLKLFEYMALRRPVLCSDLPVLREILQHGRNALLADPAFPADWAAHIETLKDTPDIAQKLADEAYGDIVSRYSWDIRARAVSVFLERLS